MGHAGFTTASSSRVLPQEMVCLGFSWSRPCRRTATLWCLAERIELPGLALGGFGSWSRSSASASHHLVHPSDRQQGSGRSTRGPHSSFAPCGHCPRRGAFSAMSLSPMSKRPGAIRAAGAFSSSGPRSSPRASRTSCRMDVRPLPDRGAALLSPTPSPVRLFLPRPSVGHGADMSHHLGHQSRAERLERPTRASDDPRLVQIAIGCVFRPCPKRRRAIRWTARR